MLRNESLISGSAGIDRIGGGGDGLSITINASTIAAIPSEDSDIVANAFDGKGGTIQINTRGLFGIQPRSRLTELSDINARSELGLDGTVTINGLTVDPSQGLTDLPSQPLDASRLIAQGCGTVGTAIALAQREFVVSGRGGLPAAPGDVQGGEVVAAGWADQGAGGRDQGSGFRGQGLGDGALEPTPQHPITPSLRHSNTPTSLMEAQGWLRDESGQVRLVAEVPLTASSPIAAVPCGEGRSPTRDSTRQ